METITVKEALEKGYTNYVYDDDGYQSLKDIADDVKDGCIDFNRKDLSVVAIDPIHPDGMDADEIRENLAELLQERHSDQTGDDTDSVYDAIMSLDFSQVSEMIQEKLNTVNYYQSAGIRLIP